MARKEGFSDALARLSWQLEQKATTFDRGHRFDKLWEVGLKSSATALLALSLIVSLPAGILGRRGRGGGGI